MALFKRGDVYHYEFVRNGVQYRKSTGTGNLKAARDIETAAKNRIALRVNGLPTKEAVPLLCQFIENEFLPSIINKKATTKRFYTLHAGNLSKSAMGNVPLDSITVPMIEAFAFQRRKKLKVSTVNRDLATLRRIFNLAVEWRRLPTMPKVTLLTGEARRERVVTKEDETKYLAVAKPLLRDVATLLFDLGLRPDECFKLRLENFRDGFCHVFVGKREGSRRRIPCTDRVLEIVSRRTEGAGPSALLFFTFTRMGRQRPVDGSSIRKQHLAALKASKVEPFVIYSVRHSAITRWSQNNTDTWTLQQLAGHKSLATTQRYVHSEADDARLRAAVGL